MASSSFWSRAGCDAELASLSAADDEGRTRNRRTGQDGDPTNTARGARGGPHEFCNMATSRILQGVGCANRWNERILRGWGAEGVKWAGWVRRGVPGAARFGVGSRGAAVPGGSAVLEGFVQAGGLERGAERGRGAWRRRGCADW